MTRQVPGGPSAQAVAFAMLRLETKYALSSAAWHRLKLAALLSAHVVPLPESPDFQCLFNLVHNIERFKLTRHVTYSQYRAACGSGRIDIAQLIPPEFPVVTLLHTFTKCPNRPSHTSCSHGQAWIWAATRSFESREEAFAALCSDRNIYLCSVCD